MTAFWKPGIGFLLLLHRGGWSAGPDPDRNPPRSAASLGPSGRCCGYSSGSRTLLATASSCCERTCACTELMD